MTVKIPDMQELSNDVDTLDLFEIQKVDTESEKIKRLGLIRQAGIPNLSTFGEAVSLPGVQYRALASMSLDVEKKYLAPFHVIKSITITELIVSVVNAGNAGYGFRFGIYKDTGSFNWTGDGNLVLDAGTVPADSSGKKSLSTSTTLSEGFYWTSIASYGVVGVGSAVFGYVSPIYYTPFLNTDSYNTSFSIADTGSTEATSGFASTIAKTNMTITQGTSAGVINFIFMKWT